MSKRPTVEDAYRMCAEIARLARVIEEHDKQHSEVTTHLQRELRSAEEAKNNLETNYKAEIARLKEIIVGQAGKAVGR